MLCSGVEGHAAPRSAFERAIATGRLAHAYLFAGPRGIGKSLFAIELAAALVCERATRGGADGACRTCVSCRLALEGRHRALTVIAPPAGKRIEIDTIRELGEALAIHNAPRRIVILNDADRLWPASANAFLKLLEEPPPGVLFMLVTSRAGQLIETIISRCHRVPFAPLSAQEFERAMERAGVAAAEIDALPAPLRHAPGRALELLRGIEELGGWDRFHALVAGVGSSDPESLLGCVPERPQEAKRDRVRRLLDLLLEGMWSAGHANPEDTAARILVARRALRMLELVDELDGMVNPELILEQTVRLFAA